MREIFLVPFFFLLHQILLAACLLSLLACLPVYTRASLAQRGMVCMCVHMMANKYANHCTTNTWTIARHHINFGWSFFPHYSHTVCVCVCALGVHANPLVYRENTTRWWLSHVFVIVVAIVPSFFPKCDARELENLLETYIYAMFPLFFLVKTHLRNTHALTHKWEASKNERAKFVLEKIAASEKKRLALLLLLLLPLLLLKHILLWSHKQMTTNILSLPLSSYARTLMLCVNVCLRSM